ncbi:MAG: hypothetical protein ACI31V_01835 [Bacilli bacterium]
MDYRKVVEYIVDSYREGRLVTVLDASHKFDCSVSSIRKYIARLKGSIDENDKKLYNSYLVIAGINQLNGQVLGGKKGKRLSTFSSSDVSDLCDFIVENDCTLRQMEKISGIPKSTLYENLSKLNDSRLQDIYDEHRHNSLNDYMNDFENNLEFHSVGSEISKRCTSKKK